MKMKELRKQANLTQEEISKIFNITQKTYSNYENEITQPDIKLLINLADYYNVSLDYLIGRNYKNEIGYLEDHQIDFIKAYLCLNEANQRNTAIYVATLLAKQ